MSLMKEKKCPIRKDEVLSHLLKKQVKTGLILKIGDQFHSLLLMPKCDPPRENREKGECTGTRAMARHAKRVTDRTDMCIFIKQNKECHG